MSRLEFRCRYRYPGGFELNAPFATERPVTALFGPSGSGKTSVLELIAGLKRPHEGRIELTGRTLVDTARGDNVPMHRRRVGMVFQDLLLFPHLNVERNLCYGSRRGGEKGVNFERVVSVLELDALLRRFPRNLSGGERQRVALGRALLSSPQLLLMDEPLAALDDALKHRILAYLERAVAEWHIPVLFVSHSQAEVRRLADWVVVLDGGRVVTEGAPDDALTQPVPLAWRDAAGPANLLRLDRVEREGDRWMGRVGGQTLRLPPIPSLSEAPVFVQFSPQAVVLSRREVPDISARNHLRGVVRRLVEASGAVFVAVDAGPILWAEVTPEAVRDLELQPGAEVICHIKTHSLEIVD